MLMDEVGEYTTKQKEGFKKVLTALVSMIQVKNKRLYHNGQWVSKFAVQIAKHLGLSARQISEVQLGGHLKNFGLILLPDLFTEKTLSMLSKDELHQYFRYPVIGEQILGRLPGFAWFGSVAGDTLERYNGSGPKGKAGDEISISAQIISIADDAYRILFPKSAKAGKEVVYGRNLMVSHIRKNIKKLYGIKVAQAAMLLLTALAED